VAHKDSQKPCWPIFLTLGYCFLMAAATASKSFRARSGDCRLTPEAGGRGSGGVARKDGEVWAAPCLSKRWNGWVGLGVPSHTAGAALSPRTAAGHSLPEKFGVRTEMQEEPALPAAPASQCEHCTRTLTVHHWALPLGQLGAAEEVRQDGEEAGLGQAVGPQARVVELGPCNEGDAGAVCRRAQPALKAWARLGEGPLYRRAEGVAAVSAAAACCGSGAPRAAGCQPLAGAVRVVTSARVSWSPFQGPPSLPASARARPCPPTSQP
jgi:hypothetical protein